MFQIKKIYETDFTMILKIEGEITDQGTGDWVKEMQKAINHSSRDFILEFCEVTFMSSNALERLIKLVSKNTNIYVLNCPTTVRNTMQTAGLSANVLV